MSFMMTIKDYKITTLRLLSVNVDTYLCHGVIMINSALHFTSSSIVYQHHLQHMSR